MVLDLRAGYARFDLDFTQADVEEGDQLGIKLGVPNANQQEQQNAIPIFSPAGYTGIGHSRSLPILRVENTFQYVGQSDLHRKRAYGQDRAGHSPPPFDRVPD